MAIVPVSISELREVLAETGLAVDATLYHEITRESLVYGIVTRLHYVPIDILRFLFRVVHAAQVGRPESAGWQIMRRADDKEQ